MAERMFTSNAYKVVEALAQKLGFSTLEDYLQTLFKIEAKEFDNATLSNEKSLENIRNGIKEGLRQIWGDGLPGGTLLDEPDNEGIDDEGNKRQIISVDDIRNLIDDIWWENRFELAAKMPLTWLISARRLRRSADLLHSVAETASQIELERFVQEMEATRGNLPSSRELTDEEMALSLDSSVSVVAIMLQGLAIENLAKGILVGRNAEDLVVGGSFRRGTHDLVKLVVECKIPLTDKEQNILEITTDYINWRGRYLVPMSVDKLRPKQKETGNGFIDTLAERENFHRGDYEVLVSICDRLFVVYEDERRKRWAEEDKSAQSNK